MPTVKIGFFGRLAEQAGSVVVIEVPAEGVVLRELRKQLSASLVSSLNDLRNRAVVGDEFVGEETRIMPGDEVEFFAPLSGG